MRAGIIVGPRGVEQVVSVGHGIAATQDCVQLMRLIWPEVEAFHKAILACIPPGPDDDDIEGLDPAKALIHST
jgi:hypothetical protein